MKQWIMGIFSASLLGSMAMALCPEGRVKPVLRMLCGIICALTVVSPLLEADLNILSAQMAAYGQRARIIAREAEEESKMMERTYIEEQCAAYILAKGRELQAEVERVSVRAVWDDAGLVWYPWEVEISGLYSAALSSAVEAELGVPPQRQTWSGDG